MRLIANPLPPGSYEVAIWNSVPSGDLDPGTDIDTVCNIVPLYADHCRVTHAKGDLSEDANVAIGLKCFELGFRVMHFEVTPGTKVSHHATFEGSWNGVDNYKVDLAAEIAKL